ncbi:MAG TPA: protein phosphatase 2C domain-containing protein [Candidatus Binataceae bacterium]|nr:protein phosphatase 2C domain-containing protein [Candidatus Binataceae bacterium]
MSESENKQPSAEPAPHAGVFDLALLSDVGTNRPDNEDSCGHLIEGPDSVVFAVADGIGGYEGGEVASAMAIELTLQAWRESPATWGPAKRLVRAVQFANIEIHNRALAVPELRRMGTTLTAVTVDKGMLAAAHVGDCRLYLARHHKISQLTKDHTMVAEKVRMGLLSAERARNHPERSMLVRSIGQELIVSVDRISIPLLRGDRLILCSDGLHGVLRDNEIEQMTRDLAPTAACRTLVETANERGTADNLTVAVFTMLADTGLSPTASGWRAKLGRMFGTAARGGASR